LLEILVQADKNAGMIKINAINKTENFSFIIIMSFHLI